MKCTRLSRRRTASEFDLEWLPPIGFNNTYAITVRAAHADEHGWQADQRPRNDVATGYPRDSRQSSWNVRMATPVSAARTAFDFGQTADLDPGLMYKASGGRAGRRDLRVCHGRTHRSVQPARPPRRPLVLPSVRRGPGHPQCVCFATILKIRDALAALAGTISDQTMRRLNYAVDELRRTPSSVASEWIESRAVGIPQSTADASNTADGRCGGFLGNGCDAAGGVVAEGA